MGSISKSNVRRCPSIELRVLTCITTFLLLTGLRTPLDLPLTLGSCLIMAAWPSSRLPAGSAWRIDLAAALLGVISILIQGSPDGTLSAFIGGCITILGVRGLARQIASQGKPLTACVAWTATGTALLSCLVLIASTQSTTGDSIRQWAYPNLDQLIERAIDTGGIIGEATQGGLSPTTVSMGYQLAMVAPLLFGWALSRRRSVIVGTLTLGLFAFGLLLLGQRSALAASILGLLGLLLAVPEFRRRALLAGTLIAACGVLYAPTILDSLQGRSYNLLQRWGDSTGDPDERFSVQLWAIQQIPHRPFGFGSAEEYRRHGPVVGNRVIGPHNHLITITILYGWTVGLILSMLIVLGLDAAFRSLGLLASLKVDNRWPACFALCLLTVLLNGFAHNSGLASLDGPSMLALFMVLATCSFETDGHCATTRRTSMAQPA